MTEAGSSRLHPTKVSFRFDLRNPSCSAFVIIAEGSAERVIAPVPVVVNTGIISLLARVWRYRLVHWAGCRVDLKCLS